MRSRLGLSAAGVESLVWWERQMLEEELYAELEAEQRSAQGEEPSYRSGTEVASDPGSLTGLGFSVTEA